MPPKKSVAASTVADEYVKLKPEEHILHRPDSYIGSIVPEKTMAWIWNEETSSMEKAEIDYNPGLLKIVDEILTNASDHVVRQKELADKGLERKVHLVKNIQVTVNR